MKKKIIFSIILSVVLISIFAFSGFASFEQGSENVAEINSIKETLTNYKLGNALGGVLNTDDGTNKSLTEEELQSKISSYNEIIDSAYSQNHPCYSTYKEYNEYLLRDVFTEQQDSIYVDAGVVDIRIINADINEKNETATVKYVSTLYFRSVFKKDNLYTPHVASGRNYEEVELVKDEDSWKVEKSIELTPWDCSCYDEDEVKNVVSDMRSCVNYSSTFADRKSISDEEESAIRDEIKNSQQINSMTFDTFAEARDAAMTVDVVNGNYYALY